MAEVETHKRWELQLTNAFEDFKLPDAAMLISQLRSRGISVSRLLSASAGELRSVCTNAYSFPLSLSQAFWLHAYVRVQCNGEVHRPDKV